MTDTDKLKRLKKEIKRKEFWRETRDSRDYVIDEICDADDYGAEERYVYSDWLRDAILALIAENERLDDIELRHNALWDTYHQCQKQRDEAVALLREAHEAYGAWTGKTCKQEQADDANAAFLARIDAAE